MKTKRALAMQLTVLGVVALLAAAAVLPYLLRSDAAHKSKPRGSLAIESIADGGKIAAFGLDISSWQQDVDFEAVYAAGADYVILRAGYQTSEDAYFAQNYTRAKAAGLDVGIYWYSYAATPEEAYAEAIACMDVLTGKTFEYPIYFDYEDPCQDTLSPEDHTQICTAFLDTLSNEGYYVGLYSYLTRIENYITTQPLQSRYARWLACFPDSGTYATLDRYCDSYGMWQYSCTGAVSGISGDVDMDISFVDYPSIIRAGGYNGYANTLSESTLTLSGANYPTLLNAGQPLSLGGMVTSTEGSITQLTVGLFTADGTMVTGELLSPDSDCCDLAAQDFSCFDSSLEPGDYYLRIIAENTSQKLTLLNVQLHITPQAYTLTDFTLPNRIASGNQFRLCGTIDSPDTIQQLSVQLVDSSNAVIALETLSLEGQHVELPWNLSEMLDIPSLSAGQYRYQIFAGDTRQAIQLLSHSFVVTGHTQANEGVLCFAQGEQWEELEVVWLDNGTCRLENPSSHMVLTPEYNGTCAGTRLLWAKEDSLPGQCWFPICANDGTFAFLSAAGNVYLDFSAEDAFACLSPVPVWYTLTEPDAQVAAQLDTPTSWTLVTSAGQLQPGDRILLAAAEYDVALSCTQTNNCRAACGIYQFEGYAAPGEDVQILTVAEGYQGIGIALYDETAQGYLGNTTAMPHLQTFSVLSSSTCWILAVEDGIVTLQNAANTELFLSYNNELGLFHCTISQPTPLAIYRYME